MNAVMVAIDDSECECGGLRVIDHPRLGSIRCPKCTTVELPRDANTFRRLKAIDAEFRLNGAEERRVRRAMARLIALTLAGDAAKFARMDADLISTDRILQRWGVDEGTGLPATNPDVYRIAQLPCLDDRTQEKVTDIVKASPLGIRHFCEDVYTSHIPVAVLRGGPYFSKSGEPRPGRHLSERDWYREKASILRYLRFQFERSKHPDLVALARCLP